MEKNQNLNNKNYIEYSTKTFDSINKERPSFILKDLEVKNDKGDINRILAIILKYKINSKEQEAGIGTMQNLDEHRDKEREFSKIVKKVSKKIIEDEKIHSDVDDNASR